MDEDELIARAVDGDGDAFSELVRRYQGMAYNVAYRILGDTEDAADATQDALLSAYRAMRSFRRGSFRSWLMRIVTNACYDCLRRVQRHPVASLDSGEDADWHECLADPGESPETIVERQDQSRQIQHALAALPPNQRVVVVLSDLQGLRYDDIADVLRVPLGTVRSRLSRGRRALGERLLHEELSPRAGGDAQPIDPRPIGSRAAGRGPSPALRRSSAPRRES